MIVVAGGSLGGLRTVEQLRAHGYTGSMRIVGDERHLPCNRPPSSKGVLSSTASLSETLPESTFRQRTSTADAQRSLGTKTFCSNLADRVVELDKGETVAHHGLVVATGLFARRLDTCTPAAGRFVIRTIDDSLVLRARLRPGIRAVIVGAGFIGCEIAAAATALGCQVTIVEGSSGPMENSIGRKLSDTMKPLMEDYGGEFRTGRVVGLLTALDQRCVGFTLDDGSQLAADVVVESIGSLPNVEWLDGNNLDLTDGGLCDDSMRVRGATRAVAVGDIARFPDQVLGGDARRVEHWATAGDTAKIAAATLVADLAGQASPAAVTPTPSFWTELCEVRLVGVGSPGAATSVRELEGDLGHPARGVALGYFREELLAAVVTVTLPSNRQLHYRGLVATARELASNLPAFQPNPTRKREDQ
ncbi:FAD/NAD(P)-binding oxidoreductase [Marisediminicola antarctica]|uniref:FAD/NAD(P)-binding domain-containing protein n=1 Tax=Marisediminicola antarctica TaxID=674079 RepID=A0A7L5AMC9_9MICO|nr:hypothetical protein BHD05_07130 [Marisediminicola antarctica]